MQYRYIWCINWSFSRYCHYNQCRCVSPESFTHSAIQNVGHRFSLFTSHWTSIRSFLLSFSDMQILIRGGVPISMLEMFLPNRLSTVTLQIGEGESEGQGKSTKAVGVGFFLNPKTRTNYLLALVFLLQSQHNMQQLPNILRTYVWLLYIVYF